MNDLFKRVMSGIIGLLLLIIIIHKGGLILSTAIFLVSIIGIRELFGAFEKIDIFPNHIIGLTSTFLIFANYTAGNRFYGLVIFISLILLMSQLLINKKASISGLSVTLLGFFYIPIMLFHLMLMDKYFIYMTFIIAFGSDTFAYFVGNLFGKNKLAPQISPNKTIEGAIGGVFGSILLVVLYSLVTKTSSSINYAILGGLGSIISQTGDLIASKIKRLTGIKDYGFIMPGHGGILDRFDSIIFVAPFVYYYALYFVK